MSAPAHPGVDGHSDTMMDVARRRLRGERRVLARQHLPALRQGGVGLQFLMVGGDFPLFAGDFPAVDHLRQALELLEAFHCECEETPDELRLIRSVEDLVELQDSDQVGFVLHWEGGNPAESLSMLRLGWRLGLRAAGLAWSGATRVADASGARRGAGLSDYGHSLVAEMNRLGMIVDVSHLSDQGVDDVCRVATAPVIASHTNARAVHDHPRNLPDEHLRRIAATGGVIGVCAYPPMLTTERRPTLQDMVRHAVHLVELVGSEHVGIGCDFTDSITDIWTSSAPMRSFTEDFLRPFPEGFRTPGDLPRLCELLASAGFGDSELQAILGGNLLRVLRACLPTRGESDVWGLPRPPQESEPAELDRV